MAPQRQYGERLGVGTPNLAPNIFTLPDRFRGCFEQPPLYSRILHFSFLRLHFNFEAKKAKKSSINSTILCFSCIASCLRSLRLRISTIVLWICVRSTCILSNGPRSSRSSAQHDVVRRWCMRNGSCELDTSHALGSIAIRIRSRARTNKYAPICKLGSFFRFSLSISRAAFTYPESWRSNRLDDFCGAPPIIDVPTA